MTFAIETTAPKFKTADGREFDTRKDAVAHQVTAVRTVKVQAVLDAATGIAEGTSVAALIATLGDELIAALSNPLERGRKKAEAAPAAA